MKTSILLLAMPGGWELIIIAVVILLLFGGRKIPELMRGLGSGIKEFKKATKDEPTKSPSIDLESEGSAPAESKDGAHVESGEETKE